LARVRRLGPNSLRWAESVVQARGVEAVRVLVGLMSLAERHPWNAIERACGIASAYGVFRLSGPYSQLTQGLRWQVV
jgi:hypothetical protein